MPIYTVTLLGKSFMVDADNNYQARRLAAAEYRQIDSTIKSATLRTQCVVRVSEEFDGRIKYAPTSEVGK